MHSNYYKIGQYVIARNEIASEEGKIVDIKMSTGTRKELIYKIGINWFFTNEIIKIVNVNKSPNEYFNNIFSLRDDAIKDLFYIIKNSNKSYKYIKNCIEHYVLKFRKEKNTLIQIGINNNFKFDKIDISEPDCIEVIKSSTNKRINISNIPNEIFNIYSYVYSEIIL